MIKSLNELKVFFDNYSVDEIIKNNLLKFYSLNDKEYTLDELEKKYQEEEFNEIRKPISYFRDNILDIKKNIEKYIWVYESILDDEKSKKVFINMINAKVFMNVDIIDEVYDCNEEIYYDKAIWGSLDNEIYVDCGGYTGDTAMQFMKSCPDYSKIYIYEPVPEIARKCSENLNYFISEGNLTVKCNAVYSCNKQLVFDGATLHGDSLISKDGKLLVNGIALDEEVQDNITFIKMDIEGSEKEAILGVKNHIKNDNPKLAICIYHLSDDFWRIPELIHNINPNYRFKVRQHLSGGFAETVLYCIPTVTKILKKKPSNVDYLKRYKNIISCFDNYYKYQNEMYRNMLKAENWFLYKLRVNNENSIEIKKWNDDLVESKTYLDRQLNNYMTRVSELESWINELENGKQYLEKQNTNLESWINELESGKKYLEEQNILVNNNNKNIEKENENLQLEITNLRNNYSKLKYKMGKIVNDPIVKKIIKWKKYDL